tara:strand:+ start:40 stop:186 length:147 start_codon:yes stop_codon:yes gene_type:complete
MNITRIEIQKYYIDLYAGIKGISVQDCIERANDSYEKIKYNQQNKLIK